VCFVATCLFFAEYQGEGIAFLRRTEILFRREEQGGTLKQVAPLLRARNIHSCEERVFFLGVTQVDLRVEEDLLFFGVEERVLEGFLL